jgi:hypothetical protein
LATKPHSHATTITLRDPPPQEVPAGSDFNVKLSVSCPAGCDLRDRALQVVSPDGADATEGPPVGEDDNVVAITLTAPPRVGEHVWMVALSPCEVGGVPHAEAALSIAIKTIPNATSLAVWDIPSPVTIGQKFAVKVGAKSAAGIVLQGRSVEICDAGGAVVARGALGDTPWPGTSALYWTQLELTAPAEAGVCSWSTRFSGADVELPHDGAAYAFSVAVIGRPEHRLTVKVVESETANPIEEVEVRLGPYRAATDFAGLAEIDIAKGTYELNIWKVGYEAPARMVAIDADAAVEVAAAVVPEEDPDALWTT